MKRFPLKYLTRELDPDPWFFVKTLRDCKHDSILYTLPYWCPSLPFHLRRSFVYYIFVTWFLTSNLNVFQYPRSILPRSRKSKDYRYYSLINESQDFRDLSTFLKNSSLIILVLEEIFLL